MPACFFLYEYPTTPNSVARPNLSEILAALRKCEARESALGGEVALAYNGEPCKVASSCFPP